MKKTLLLFTLLLSALNPVKTFAQEFPYDLTLFEDVIFYGMYEATVSEPIPAGAIRHTNSSYAKKLTDEMLASFGNTLTMTVKLNPRCDNYDRIGNVNLALVPKGATSYIYNEVTRIEIGRFITPFMDMHDQPNEVPYVFHVDNLTKLFQDDLLKAEFDYWIEFEVYGYQGGPGQGGAAVEIPGCAGRNDVYQGTLEFKSYNNTMLTYQSHFLYPLSYKFELKDYTLDGTDVLNETVKTINFTLEEDVPNAKIYLITSNHGSNQNGEEYNRRNHFIYFDDEQVLMYKPGGTSCEPFRQYNTQANGIYGLSPRPLSQWLSFNNWCPGDKIPIRVINLGDLEAGEHNFRIEVPDAVFAGDQGYFPMSVYLQGGAETLGTENFEQTGFKLFPNPTNGYAEIVSDENVKSVEVYNTLGQAVWKGNSKMVNLAGLQKGVYMVHVEFEGDRVMTKKIIKN